MTQTMMREPLNVELVACPVDRFLAFGHRQDKVFPVDVPLFAASADSARARPEERRAVE